VTKSNLFISTQCIKKSDIVESIDLISEITPNIELSGGYKHDKILLERLREIKSRKKLNLLIHGYFPPPEEHFVLNFADTGEKTRSFIRETMRFIDELDVDYYSVHAGFKRDFDVKDEILINPRGQHYTLSGINKNIEWFRKEFPGKKIAIENLYPVNRDVETSLVMHIDEIIELLEENENVYLLLDLGHLKISAELLGFDCARAARLLFEKYNDKIIEIHLSENNARSDDHFIVYPDSIQYVIIKEYAAVIKRDNINVTIEARNSIMRELSECFANVSEVVSKDMISLN